MSLRDAVDGYIAWRRAHGAKFDAGTYLLHQFCKHAGGNTGCDAIAEADVLSFLSGKGPLTAYRANKHSALAGFYRYAISRGYATSSPLPARDAEPRRPRPAPPYVYSRNELQRLFGAIDASRQRSVQLGADTLRALLLLLYGAGLRLGEAERLTLEDADLPDALLTIRDTKFYKARRLSATCRQASSASRRVRHLSAQTGVRQARRRRVRARSSAAANAVAEHPRERSGEPVQRASRSAIGGGMEARDSGPSMYPRSRSGD